MLLAKRKKVQNNTNFFTFCKFQLLVTQMIGWGEQKNSPPFGRESNVQKLFRVTYFM